MTNSIKWGMIGAGDVTEVKSGPAFKKVPHSDLVAVMRRDAVKVQDYARRHGIRKWYTDAKQLIDDEEVNAVYIATPPDTHLQYCMMALQAGKAVYVEKPVTLNVEEAMRLANYVQKVGGCLSVAHYRREQPYFKKIVQIIDDGLIGEPLVISLQLLKKSLTEEMLQDPKIAWRLDPAKSGGGLFHDLAPHQLDIIYRLFGPIQKSEGLALNLGKRYPADDVVTGGILFENDVLFNGLWAFNVTEEVDRCEIFGSKGKLTLSFFTPHTIELMNGEGVQVFHFEALKHVQQPMIEAVVGYLRGERGNPCSIDDALEVATIMQNFTNK